MPKKGIKKYFVILSSQMINPSEIRKLCFQRLQEAEILFNNGMTDGAFYLAGYSVELMLKAKICERLGIPNLFDEADPSLNTIKGIGDIKKVTKTHNLLTLLILSGLKVKFDTDKATDRLLAKSNSLLFNAWDENARYKVCGHFVTADVRTLIQLLNDPNGLLKWIENN